MLNVFVSNFFFFLPTAEPTCKIPFIDLEFFGSAPKFEILKKSHGKFY